MNRPVKLSPRAALFIGAALLSTPAFAQEQVAPPPVVSTAPAPALAPAPAQRVYTMAPPAPVVQAVPETPPVAETPARAPARTAAPRSTTTTRQVTRTATAPAPAPAAPVAEAPAPAAVPLVTGPVASAPTASDASTTTSSETTTTEPAPTAAPAEKQGAPIWPWALLGVLVLAGIVVAFMLRRRPAEATTLDEPVRAAPVYAEPEPVRQAAPPRAEPLAAAAPFIAADPLPPFVQPVVHEAPVEHIETEAVVHDAEKADLDAVMDADAPVAHRPWLEFGMRPVRAGTTDEEATVEIELTVGNTGDEPARNVRITTFMLADGDGTDMEHLLVEHANDAAAVPPVSIPAGEGTRIDATLATPKGDLGRMFNPIIVADARYTLPDGSEGRTAAAFKIGRMGVEGLGAIGSSRPHIVENVDAELEQLLERA